MRGLGANFVVVRGGMASPRAGLGFRAGGGGWLEGRRYGGQRGFLGGGWQGWGVEMMKICGMIVQDMHLKVLGEKPGCRPPHP